MGEADVSKVTALVQGLRPDILLLSLSASSTTSIDAMQRIAAAGVGVRTILLTRSVDGPEILNALRFGVCGVVPKDTTAEMLFKTIESVMAGHYWVGRECVQELIENMCASEVTRDPARHQATFDLTARQMDIISAIVMGASNDDIAKQFSISPHTVKYHLTNMFEKLGVIDPGRTSGHAGQTSQAKIHLLGKGLGRLQAIIGDGAHKPELDAEIARRHLDDRVRRVGRVAQDEGARLLKACDMYVSPHNTHMVDSKFFGSPTKPRRQTGWPCRARRWSLNS